MNVFKGNTNTNAIYRAQVGCVVSGFSLVNKTAATIGINVYLIDSNSNSICIAPLNQQLTTGQMYQDELKRIILPTEQIKLQVSGSTDYDFNIESM